MTNTNITLEPRVRDAIRQLRDLPGNLESEDSPTFTIEQVNFLEKRLYEVRSLLEGEDHSQLYTDIALYVCDLLAEHRQIAAIWSIEDMQGIRPDLSEDQAWEVLKQAGDKHDADWGLSWTTLETIAEDLFGAAPETEEDGSQL